MDECFLNTDNCVAPFVCENIVGSFRCSCPAGMVDDGSGGCTCAPPAISNGSGGCVCPAGTVANGSGGCIGKSVRREIEVQT